MREFKILCWNINGIRAAKGKGFLEWLQAQSLANGYITEDDFKLLRVSDDPKEIVDIIRTWYLRQAIIGRQALS